ncbi:MAG: asparagine synthase (glutamine-hydrolyzing) [Raineya sp.]|nr:asparagine synthase (glutamine-hydrolyzing) [Raineya sp.]
MCGITGLLAFNEVGRFSMINLQNATDVLSQRGPDWGDTYLAYWAGLGHRRLSIIDTSPSGNQPISDHTGRYTIVFNGEIYNYQSLRQQLAEKGILFRTQSDTEVLLYAYIVWGTYALELLHGFFAFAIYDKDENSLFLARDRYGVKPLLYYLDEDRFLFASEMKSLLQYGIEKKLNLVALRHYLHLNYIPAPHTIFENIYKLLPGHFAKVQRGKMEIQCYYQIPKNYEEYPSQLSYQEQQIRLKELLTSSIRKRLVADVPVGAFLSGGVDSSIAVALASQEVENLQTFSIGYYENRFFDETHYAEIVAKHFRTKHTTFKLSNKDLLDHLESMLNYLDEPFADSSALPVFILSKFVKQHVKVAISGDGADEMWGGYNKHFAEYQIRKGGLLANLVTILLPLWKQFPQSRNNFWSNKFRQLVRFAEGSQLSAQERYWLWAGFCKNDEVEKLLHLNLRTQAQNEYQNDKMQILQHLQKNDVEGLNEVFYTDMQLVLPNDMLTKVDLMSMANGLELREPFLDHELVSFVFSLPVSSKINQNIRKRLLQDTFREILPAEIYKRPKHGFEVPLLDWLRTDLRSMLENELLQDRFVEEQGIFDVVEVKKLKNQLFSNNPQDSHARIWGLLVFQHWWKRLIRR